MSFCYGNIILRELKRIQKMGCRKKYPEHEAETEKMMNTLLDELVSLWTSMPDPEVKEIADELEMSRTKVRKLLITAGVRDGVQYYS